MFYQFGAVRVIPGSLGEDVAGILQRMFGWLGWGGPSVKPSIAFFR